MYTPPAPEVIIISSKQHGDGRNAFITYTLSVTYMGKQWNIDRRYSEFHDLYNALHNDIQSIPPLPSKTWYNPAQWFGKSLDTDFIQQRQNELQLWIQQISSYEYVLRSNVYRAFLFLNLHFPAPASGANTSTTTATTPTDPSSSTSSLEFQPRQLKTEISTLYNNIHHGINSCVYLENEFILLCACEQATLLGRVDAKVSGMKMPWSYFRKNTTTATSAATTSTTTQQHTNTPLGSFCVLKMDGEAKWNVIYHTTYDSAATCITVDHSTNSVCVGLDNGKVLLYQSTSQYDNYTLSTVLQPHTDRVTGIVCHSKRSILCSVSRDKNLATIDLNKRLVLCTVQTNFPLECIESDFNSNTPMNQRIFIGNRGGSISVYDITAEPPMLMHTLTGHNQAVRCLHYNAEQRYLFSGGYDSLVGIYTIGKDNREITRSRAVGWLHHGPAAKIKCITYCQSERQVSVGLVDGRIAVHNTENGHLVGIWQAFQNQCKYIHWVDSAKIVLAGALDGHMKFFRWPNSQEIEREYKAVLESGAAAAAANNANVDDTATTISNFTASSSSSSIPHQQVSPSSNIPTLQPVTQAVHGQIQQQPNELYPNLTPATSTSSQHHFNQPSASSVNGNASVSNKTNGLFDTPSTSPSHKQHMKQSTTGEKVNGGSKAKQLPNALFDNNAEDDGLF